MANPYAGVLDRPRLSARHDLPSLVLATSASLSGPGVIEVGQGNGSAWPWRQAEHLEVQRADVRGGAQMAVLWRI